MNDGAQERSREMYRAAATKRWQKVLYQRQPYPDNHVDDTFLTSLVTNANVQQYEYWSMVRATAVITQQISVMAMFFIIFAFVNQETVSVSTIATVNAVVVVALLLWFRFSGPQFYTPSLVPAIPTMLKYAAIFLAVLFALSPILQTLTQSYSNDTIWAQTILLAAMHICFHNYHITSSTSAVSGAFSFNAIMFAAALMASRLPSTTHVFIFVVLAIELFALYPLVRDYIRVRSERAHLWVTVVWVASALALLTAASTLLAIVYAAAVTFITLLAPLALLKAQAYKNEIQGPWDIATVTQFST